MSETEREFLARIYKLAASSTRRWILAAGNAFVFLAASLLAFVLVWAAVAWVIRRALGRDYGWESPIALWVVLSGVLVCAGAAIISTARWVRSWPDDRRALVTDLNGGVVVDEVYHFVAVKRFQEPEHGGLIYFLRTTDENVLVLYDAESQSLGAGGEDPLASPFRPRSELVMARAPATKYVLDKRFTGTLMDLDAPVELAVPPKEWPEQDELCEIPWDQLEKRLGLQAS
jgi:hypothetical protein